MSVTIKDIASEANVSWQTVSLVMHGTGRISEATRRKVKKVADRMGYRPNAAARAYRTGRFDCVALVLAYNEARSDLPTGLLYGIQNALARNNLHFTVARLPDDELTRAGFVPKVLRENFADGMLINVTHDIPDKMLDLIQESRAPAVWLNTDLPTDCVCPDDESASFHLARHLIELGHRKIAYVKTDSSTHYSTRERRSGFAKALLENGLRPYLIERSIKFGEQTELFDPLLTGASRPSAMIVRPEDVATVAYMAACRGIRIPDDLSLACIAASAPHFADMMVTSAIVPSDTEGAEAVTMLLAKIKKPEIALPTRRTPFAFGKGHTCAPWQNT
ncbi:MAG: LacI family transcriptional regulator [Lentisphaerae bacterium]|nr:LacI family transcriptional regulator [Lentisphaerota bacterium]